MEIIHLEVPPDQIKSLRFSKEVWGWAIYDFANTIFSMNILTLYFASWVIIDHGLEDIWYSLTFSGSMLLVAVSMPVLGAISDVSGKKKTYLLVLTLGCVLATVLMGIISRLPLTLSVEMILALFAFALAVYCYEGGLVFYNAMLPEVSHHRRMGQISGLG